MRLSELIAKHKLKTLVLVQLLSLMAIISSFYLAHLVSELPSLFSRNSKQEIVLWVSTSFVTILVFALSTAVRGYVGEVIKDKTREFLLQRIVTSVISSPENTALADGAHSFYEKLAYNSKNVATFVHMVTTILPGSALLTIVAAVYLSTISFGLLILVFFLLPVSIRTIFFVGKRVSTASENLSKTLSYQAKLYIERMLAMNTIKVMGLDSQVRDEIDLAEYRTFLSRETLSRWDGIVNAVFLSFVFSLICIIVGAGAIMVSEDLLSTDKLLEFITVLVMLAYSLASISDIGSVYSKYKKSIGALNDLVLETSSRNQCETNYIAEGSAHIVISDLLHSYGCGEKFKLEIPRLEIKRHSKCALIGRSGSGKTTFTKLILGLIRPQAGGVFLVKKEQRSEPTSFKESQIFAVVEQEPLVFSGTVLKNITFNEEEYDEERLNKSLVESTFSDVLSRKGVDIDFDVGNMGARLSGGERQRLALCRALYAEAEILVLDEALSSLDRICAERVLQNLCSLNKTIIFVTHDLSSLNYFDECLLLDRGHLHRKDISGVLETSSS